MWGVYWLLNLEMDIHKMQLLWLTKVALPWVGHCVIAEISSAKQIRVYGGCFKRERLLEVGMYDESMVRNQDDELSFRLRETGGEIIQDGRIKIQYYPRNSFWHLFKQFMQYGYWKVSVIKKHPQQASLRHFLPAVLVLSFVILGLFTLHGFYGFWIFAGSYFLAVGLFSFKSAYKLSLRLLPGLIYAIFLIHISFGIGFIIGSICKPFRLKWRWFETLSR